MSEDRACAPSPCVENVNKNMLAPTPVVESDLNEKDILYLQNLKKKRVSYLNMLVKNNCNAKNGNYDNETDDVYLPKRIDCESLVNGYGKVKMLHTFQVKHLSKKKKMIKYIMTIHDDSSAVIFWQQEVDIDSKVDETTFHNDSSSSIDGKSNPQKKKLKDGSNKWKCFNMFSFESIPNMSERIHATSYSHIVPIESLSNESKTVVAAFELNRANMVWIYELDIDPSLNYHNESSTTIKKKKRKKKDNGTIYTLMKNKIVSSMNVIGNYDDKDSSNNNVNNYKNTHCYKHNKHVLTVRDNKDDGTYLISTPISSNLEKEALRQKDVDKNVLIPIFSLYKVTVGSNIGNNDKENSNKSFLKKLHTFHIDITSLPAENGGSHGSCLDSNINRVTVAVDDICTTNYGEEKNSNILPPLVGCTYVVKHNDTGHVDTYFQLWDVESKLVLKRLKISSSTFQNMKHVPTARKCTKALLFPRLNKVICSDSNTKFSKKKENVIDVNIVIHSPSFCRNNQNNNKNGNDDNGMDGENVTLIFPGRYYYVTSTPSRINRNASSSGSVNNEIWRWRNKPILLDQKSFGFPNDSSILGLHGNYSLCKVDASSICLLDMIYGNGVLINIFDEANNFNVQKKCIHFAFTSSSTTDINVLKNSIASRSANKGNGSGSTTSINTTSQKILLASISGSSVYIYACNEHICSVMDVCNFLK
jgi:hypothetical protein